MTFQQFHNALRIMASIDRDECERAGLVPRGDHNAWGEFRRNPYRWFLRQDDITARIFWNLIKERQPKVSP